VILPNWLHESFACTTESIVNTSVTFIDGKQLVIIQVLTIWFLTPFGRFNSTLMSMVKDKKVQLKISKSS
jgi:hypothetical protein